MDCENDDHITCLKQFIIELFEERIRLKNGVKQHIKSDTQINFLKQMITETIIENQEIKKNLKLINCVECNALVNYDDAIYEADDLPFMLCHSCFQKNK